MELSVFQSANGDCVLLTSAGGKRILCDGGMAKSMRDHVRSHLSQLEHIDVVHVSHIDQDHISGVLQLLEDGLRWAVHQEHLDNGDHGVNAPNRPKPPSIGAIWHNSFRAQVSKNSGAIEQLLAHTAPVLLGSQVADAVALGADYQRISASIKEALKVSRLIKADLLDIPINRIPGRSRSAKLMMRRRNQKSFHVGDLKVTIVGPSNKSLESFRDGWNNWLRNPENSEIRRDIKDYIVDRLHEFANGADIDPYDLRDWNGIPSFKGVTAPNVASLVIMYEEGDLRVLVTGDAQQDLLLDDLEETGFLNSGHLHLDVLKVQHHGSEHNTDRNFCKKVSADNYIFCGNGASSNPELEVIQMYHDSRLGEQRFRADSPDARDQPFTMWFSTSSQNQHGRKRTHMKNVEELVGKLVRDSGGLMTAHFNSNDVMEIEFV